MKFISWIKEKLGLHKNKLDLADLDISQREGLLEDIKISNDLAANLRMVEEMVGPSVDIIIRRFKIVGEIPAAIVFVDGLNDAAQIEAILQTLMIEPLQFDRPVLTSLAPADIASTILVSTDTYVEERLIKAFTTIAAGNSALFVDDYDKIIMCDTRLIDTREISEPTAEISIRGPREGFIETIRTNTAMVRRRIRTPNLWFESLEVGSLTHTSIEIAYIKGLAEEGLVEEVKSRLKRIDTDSLLLSGSIEDFIADNPFSIFPPTHRTERVDVTAAELLEGRVAIFTDGTPFVLLVPASFIMFLQSPDDYSESVFAGSFFRILRVIALLISLLLPGFYVAILNFHMELLPTDLLLRIMVTREGVPFPVIVEVLFMDFLFEILREAGIRLPAAVGPAVSIVGALILGDAAIRAGLVSPAVVIIIAMTAIASFSTPGFSLGISIRLLRFVITILGAIFGLFGVQFMILLLVVHLCSLRSFGVPYLSSVAPLHWQDMKDYFIRYWSWGMINRPREVGKEEPQRIKKGQKPGPQREE